MDAQTLTSLRVALEASPSNTALLAVVLRASLDLKDYQGAATCAAAALAAGASLGTSDLQAMAAEAWVRAGQPERVVDLPGNDPALSLWKARALSELGRTEEAQATYRAAVAQNPTLEDPDLAALVKSNVREIKREGRPGLRVISNDDTDANDIDRVIDVTQPAITFADVGGLSAVKQQIHTKIILPFQKPSLFQKFRKRIGGGILLYGPPGCGKTMLARATAGECNAQFLNVSITDILDMYIGESERKLHAIFERARSSVPSILFFDELEGLAGKRQYSREATSAKLVSQFLSEMDGFTQNNQGVLILGATNVPWAVDSAFRRPGRFDRMLFIPPPDKEARVAILKLLVTGRPIGTLDLETIAKRCSGFSGADLENLVETAADVAIAASLESGHETPIEMAHLKQALEQVHATTTEWLTTARNYARYANEGGQYNDVLAFLDKHAK